MVAAIDGGKAAKDFAPDAYTPYAFIMEANGMLLVHPKLPGKDLKEVAKPIYDALQAATSRRGLDSISVGWQGEKHLCQKDQEQTDRGQWLLIPSAHKKKGFPREPLF